jgi:hypothetical protein
MIPVPEKYWNGKKTLEFEIPWIVPTAYQRLNEILTKDMNVLEFGSGGSTLFFSNRVKHVTSIETNKDWFDRISKLTQHRNNVTMFYYKTKEDLINNFPQNKFNCILIDSEGKFIKRKILFRKSIPLLIEPQILIIDNYYCRYGFSGIRNRYAFGLKDFKEENFDDKRWKGRGTKIIYHQNYKK